MTRGKRIEDPASKQEFFIPEGLFATLAQVEAAKIEVLDEMPEAGQLPEKKIVLVKRFGKDYNYDAADVSGYYIVVGDSNNNPVVIGFSPGIAGPSFGSFGIDPSELGENAIDLQSARWAAYPDRGSTGHASFTANEDTLAAGRQSTAFNVGRVQSLGNYGFAINSGIVKESNAFASANGIAYLSQSHASGAIIPGVPGGWEDESTRVQRMSLQAIRRTTDDTASELTLFGSDAAFQKLLIPTDHVWFCDIQGSAILESGAKQFHFSRRVAIENIAGTVALVAAAETIGTDTEKGAPGYSVAISADNTNKSLQIIGTGAAGEDVRWNATVRITDTAIPSA